jgi:hypothetical protein
MRPGMDTHARAHSGTSNGLLLTHQSHLYVPPQGSGPPTRRLM